MALTAFQQGFADHAAGRPYNPHENQAWQAGWDAAANGRTTLDVVRAEIGALRRRAPQEFGEVLAEFQSDGEVRLAAELEAAKAALVRLVDRISAVVPYVRATLPQQHADRDGDWQRVHAGRAFSSRNQLNNLLIDASAALEFVEAAATAEREKNR